MTFTELYRLFPTDTPDGKNVRALLMQTDWYSNIAEFDPRTAEALPQTLSATLLKISSQKTSPKDSSVLKDRLWRITEHARPSLEKLFRDLNESPRREHAILPLRAVRDLDTSSLMALSRRPGRNIREKLAGKPYLEAVRRFQSVDLPENRLLKAFSKRLAELLELRVECFGEEPDELLAKIRSWLVADEAEAIHRWDNLPPNNTLLTHRNYRAVYDSWRWLQTLDDDITKDFAKKDKRQCTMQKWLEYGKMYAASQHIFAEMPVLFDYEKFVIRPWAGSILSTPTKRPFIRPATPAVVDVPVCMDLTELYPRYALFTNQDISSGRDSCKIKCPFLWQRWETQELSASEDIELLHADAAYLHSDAITISAPDLFFSRNHTAEHLDCAARAFATKFRELFKSDTFFWLMPDFLNDFELEITRRNINARFRDAEPLPRSVAAVFENVNYKELRKGYAVVIMDTIGGKQCVTKLETRFDRELQKRLPETSGFYWERHPPVILSRKDTEEKEQSSYDIATVDAQGKWHEAQRPKITPNVLCRDKRIVPFDRLINISESPVSGGIQLYALQKRAGDIPLWCDQIPELSIKALHSGRYQRIYLVARGTTIKPIRGQAVPINVKETFTLPAGKMYYQFPLFIGENEDELGFSLKLESPHFPLKTSLQCRLNMTFTYGADDPYCLIFEPMDHSIPSIRAQWQRTVEKIITDAPMPEYPKPMTWDELRRFPKLDTDETNDLLKWVQTEIEQIDDYLYIIPQKRFVGVIECDWKTNNVGLYFSFVRCNEIARSVYINENRFLREYRYCNYQKGDYVSFELQESNGRYSGRNVAKQDYLEPKKWKVFDEKTTREIIQQIRHVLYFPVIQVWRDGRSIRDKQCPLPFRDAMATKIPHMSKLLQEEIPDTVKEEILFLLACMHKDAPDECIQWITDQVETEKIRNKRTIGFALGDVSEQWQLYVFDKLMEHLSHDALRVFAYAIWREQDFVERFTISECQSILEVLSKMLAKIKPCSPSKNRWTVRRATVEPLELLLGLLRTRSSSNDEIKMLLQPHQKLTKELAKQVERVTDLVAKSHVTLFSRVQLGNLPPKPEGDHTPDLLYALRLYLTGDDGANAIQITGVSDRDAE